MELLSGVQRKELEMTASDSQDEPNLSNLPQEVLRMILALLDGIDSLLSAISSCRAIYDAFHSFPRPLVASLVQHEIGPAVLPECVQMLRAAAIQRQSRPLYTELPKGIHHFFYAQNDALQFEWSLSNGIVAVRFHSIVNNLAQSIADEYLGHWNSLVPRKNQVPVTPSEIDRIQRALYRFEAYRNLLPPAEQADDINYKRGHEFYFSHYLPWEIEQLGSIYESLWCRAIPIFNEIAEWGRFRTPYVGDYDSSQIEHHLARGLHFIYALITAKTYADRYELVECPHPPALWEFLWGALLDYNRRAGQSPNLDTSNESDLDTATEKESHATSEAIWTWANSMVPGARIVMKSSNRPLRACGYVFWDRKRIDDSGLLDETWSEMDFDIVEDFTENGFAFDAETTSLDFPSIHIHTE